MKKLIIIIIIAASATGCGPDVNGRRILNQTDAQIEIIRELDSINTNLEKIATAMEQYNQTKTR